MVYRELSRAAAKAMAWEFLGKCFMDTRQGLVSFPVDPAAVDKFLEALAAETHLPENLAPPFWIVEFPGDGGHAKTVAYDDEHPPAHEFLEVANGLLHLPRRELWESTPSYCAFHASPVAYDEDAAPPERWLQFLHEDLWPGDPQSVATLQEFCGYLLSCETQYQKMLLIVGPIRSGKGVIARTLTAIVGEGSVVAPTLASFSERFGMEPLIGRPVGIVSDARLSWRTDSVVVAERLLSITGEDHMSVDRKYLSAWHGRLPTRFVVMSNELPSLDDAAGALVSRMLVLRLQNSFYGREDLSLEPALHAHLSGILNWCLDGYDRLRARGHFVQPAAGAESIAELQTLASPLKAFVRDRCELAPEHQVEIAALFAEYQVWAKDNNVKPRSRQMFSRDLAAAFPHIRIMRPGAHAENRARCYQGIKLKVLT